jgi:hypothetical protein
MADKTRWSSSMNFPWLSQFLYKSNKTWNLARTSYKKRVKEFFYTLECGLNLDSVL